VTKHEPHTAERLASLAVLAFRKYAPVLHRYIERRIREPNTASDLTQEIFKRFLQVKDMDAVRNPQAYLFGIASHVVREERYRIDRSLVSFDTDAINAADGMIEYASTDDAAERLSLQQDLRAALAQLPPLQRAVLLLVKRDGFSYEETAQKTQLSVATVTGYVFEARARLKMLLKHRRGG
jgi:RNA polymerase sigma-70 factor (ECF subfamily)